MDLPLQTLPSTPTTTITSTTLPIDTITPPKNLLEKRKNLLVEKSISEDNTEKIEKMNRYYYNIDDKIEFRFKNYKIHHILNLSNKTIKIQKHTREWHLRRMTSFGCSEMNKVICDKPCWRALKVFPPLAPVVNNQNAYCIWGNMFEDIAIKHVLRTIPNYTFSYCDTLFDTRLPISCSPDGFMHNDKEQFLVELKCPILRSIKSAIKQDYIAQIQTGMYVCNIFKTKFFQFRFVVCSMKHLSSKYPFHYKLDFIYPHRYEKLSTFPILKGYFVFDETDTLKGPVDISGNIHLLTELNIETRKIYVFHMNDPDAHVIPSKGFTTPYLCFKLLEFNEQIISYIPNFVTQYEDKIWEQYKLLINT